MDKLIEKLKLEMREWVDGLTNRVTEAKVLFPLYAYEYCIKEELIYYFSDNNIPEEVQQFLIDKKNTLDYLYMEYLYDDGTNIQNELAGFVDNLIFKGRLNKNDEHKV